ncbi:Alpha/Beta hydrolase protein [Aspergillus transmontanensis]|uniref:Alpha/Beta hydrolase protein n=1 Tax=Aspergillus transmontanensis TaxID=1034304 RepID=A0A5N6VU92_9EURO|nr:Alpha/Beta hydrolase protein [Aspergillus transmontanensis]
MSTVSSSRPVILVIHGTWHHPGFYAPLCQALDKLGYESVCPHLPTCYKDVPPTKTVNDDAALIRKTAKNLLDNGKHVLAVMHSYGGCAFILQGGNSLAGTFGGRLPPFIETDDQKNTLKVPDPITWFFNDVPSMDTAAWPKELVVHPKHAQFDPTKHEAYRTIPATYIVYEKDVAFIPQMQEMMIDRARKAGVNIAIERLPASHSPFLSMPEETAKLVVKIALQ